MKWRKLGIVWNTDGLREWSRSHAMCPTPFLLDETTIRVYVTTLDDKGRGRGTFVDVEASESPAAFHYFRGCFWLRNRSLPETAITCDDTPLQRDEIIPLVPGQSLRIGSHTFTLRLE